MIKLRPYQQEAVEAVYRYLREHDDNPVVVLPTAAGKTWVIGTICKDAITRWNGRVLIVAHVKELLEQAVDKLRRLCPELRIGLHSAGLKRRDTDEPVVVAGIQSVYRKACDLGPFDLILIDECHLLPLAGEGMYRKFLSDAKTVNPRTRIVGFTASPFRMDAGPICRAEHFLNAVCYEIGVKELIRDGYLSPLVTKSGCCSVDTSKLKVRAGDFVADDVEQLMDSDELVEAACREVAALTEDRRSVLIFASGVKHGRHVQRVLQDNHGIEVGFISGETPAFERDELIARFKRDPAKGLFARRPLRFLCNINVLSVGFDAPNIDCVVLLRPTASPVLYVQAVGRGFRLHPGKENCLVLDYGGNVLRHGPVDQVHIQDKSANGNGQAPAKECPQCRSVIAAGYSVCPDCGYEFPPPERPQHDAKASDAGILSGQATDTEFEVRDVAYSIHTKRDAPDDAPKTMRVDYRLGLNYWVSEWICFEHTGYARRKAEQWWGQRSPDPVPDTSDHAVELAEAGALATTETVTVRSIVGEPYDRIVGYKLGPKPEPVPVVPDADLDDDIPF